MDSLISFHCVWNWLSWCLLLHLLLIWHGLGLAAAGVDVVLVQRVGDGQALRGVDFVTGTAGKCRCCSLTFRFQKNLHLSLKYLKDGFILINYLVILSPQIFKPLDQSLVLIFNHCQTEDQLRVRHLAFLLGGAFTFVLTFTFPHQEQVAAKFALEFLLIHIFGWVGSRLACEDLYLDFIGVLAYELILHLLIRDILLR